MSIAERGESEWNILATSFRNKERYVAGFLQAYGEFKGSGFKDVIVGKVEDREGFLEALNNIMRDDPDRLRYLSQIVPIDKNFHFDVTDFSEKLKTIMADFFEKLVSCEFYVRARRRGYKGKLSSQEIEKEASGFILDALEKADKHAQVNFEDPDKLIIVETIGNRAGVGLITREMRERYSFIRVK